MSFVYLARKSCCAGILLTQLSCLANIYSSFCFANFCFCLRNKHFLLPLFVAAWRLNINANIKISISSGTSKARVDQGSAARSKLCKRAAASTRKNNVNAEVERWLKTNSTTQETLLDRKADAANANEPTPLAYLARRLFRITYLAPSDGQISFSCARSPGNLIEWKRVLRKHPVGIRQKDHGVFIKEG